MKKVHLNTAKVIIPKEFDCKSLTKINDRPDCIMFNAGFAVSNKKFPQKVLKEKTSGEIHFEPLGDAFDMTRILTFSAEKMGGGKNSNHGLILRSLYGVMKNNDPILETIKGKRIIIPIVSYEEDDMNLKTIIFDPVYTHEPVWGIDLPNSYQVTGHNAVLPILLNV